MTDEDLLFELEKIGVDRRNAAIVAVMPLVQVAWADGHVHRAERKAILAIAVRQGLVDDGGRRVLESWLTSPPKSDQVARAHLVIRELVRRHGGRDVGLETARVESIVASCQRVAVAAGAFGAEERRASAEGRNPTAEEQGVIDEVAASMRHVSRESGDDWGELLRDLATGRLAFDGV